MGYGTWSTKELKVGFAAFDAFTWKLGLVLEGLQPRKQFHIGEHIPGTLVTLRARGAVLCSLSSLSSLSSCAQIYPSPAGISDAALVRAFPIAVPQGQEHSVADGMLEWLHIQWR